MRDDVGAIIEHDRDRHEDLPRLVAALPDELALWELMSVYNWDEGFAVPLAVVEHPRCDRALALRLFWDIGDIAQHYYGDEDAVVPEAFADDAERNPEEFHTLMAYCTTLVTGIREQRFPLGRNRFDTGYFNLEDPTLTDRQRKIRAGHTKLALKTFEEAFLHPVL